MGIHEKHIQLLAHLADRGFHSGTDLAQKLAVSRTAVWKRIKTLHGRGLGIQKIKGKGYRLTQCLELLDRDRIASQLDADIRRKISAFTLHIEIDSTNQYLLDRIQGPDFHGHAVLAEYQSAGRGRRGRHWVSPFAAGICFSIGWQFDPAPKSLVLVALGAGVAVIRALHRIGIRDAGLKWPNDICWRGRKLGGTLVEAKSESAGPCRLALGTGINFCFPDRHAGEIDQPWVDIAAIQRPLCSRNTFAAALITEIVRFLSDPAALYTSRIIEEWRRYDQMQGKQASLSLPDRMVNGRILGIDDTGALLMDAGGKMETFNSGEIRLKVRH